MTNQELGGKWSFCIWLQLVAITGALVLIIRQLSKILEALEVLR
jgi:hypothetical protein